jgi:hypothetical protein
MPIKASQLSDNSLNCEAFFYAIGPRPKSLELA